MPVLTPALSSQEERGNVAGPLDSLCGSVYLSSSLVEKEIGTWCLDDAWNKDDACRPFGERVRVRGAPGRDG